MEQGNTNIQPSREKTPMQNPTMVQEERKPKFKILDPDEPYEHAPPKPDGDLWAILLEPELEADKIRCDAWKEEVQNLLIFAGLFSAVVTAFVIESYKFLRPDPNDAIIILLSQIASGPNANLSAGNSTSIAAPFAQTSSSVRINVFWFLSLILSLATVLIGTIALQWLREHQSYPVFSPKEALAIHRMRTLALDAWYVPQMFAALPLLLQGALVLFLAGLIDFTLPLGGKLAIPVACVISIILLFLAATTVLPTFQLLLLLSGRFSRNAVPNPCAFKSPQSQVFRTISGFFLHLLSFVFPTVYLRELSDFYNKDANILPPDSDQRHLFPHLYTIWHRKTWPTYDFEWLSLRDAWQQGILDKNPKLYEHRWLWKSEFPLSDITQCLVTAVTESHSAKHTEEYLIAACYCFEEISASVWGSKYQDYPWFRTDRLNDYFEQLHQDYPRPCSIANFLIHGGTYGYARVLSYDAYKLYIRDHSTLFHQDQICLFLGRLLDKHPYALPALRHQQELRLRLLQCFLQGSLPQTLAPFPDSKHLRNEFSNPMLRLAHGVWRHDARDSGIYSDSVVHLTTIFESVASPQLKQEELTNPLYTHGSICDLLKTLADTMLSFTQALERNWGTSNSDASNQRYLRGIGEEYSAVFRSVAKHLHDEISNPKTSFPSLLFYFSAVFLHRFFRWSTRSDYPRIEESSFTQGLSVLCDIVFRYKQQIATRKNKEIEMKFKGYDLVTVYQSRKASRERERFSAEWWAAFFRNYDASGLRITENDPTVPASTLPNTALPRPTSTDGTRPSTPNIARSSAPDIADIIDSSSSGSGAARV